MAGHRAEVPVRPCTGTTELGLSTAPENDPPFRRAGPEGQFSGAAERSLKWVPRHAEQHGAEDPPRYPSGGPGPACKAGLSAEHSPLRPSSPPARPPGAPTDCHPLSGLPTLPGTALSVAEQRCPSLWQGSTALTPWQY